MRCSSRSRVGHLSKLLSKILQIPPFLSLEFLCNDALLSPMATLKSVFLRHWLDFQPPMTIKCVLVTMEMKNRVRIDENSNQDQPRQVNGHDREATMTSNNDIPSNDKNSGTVTQNVSKMELILDSISQAQPSPGMAAHRALLLPIE
jgi:hypothetical protein